MNTCVGNPIDQAVSDEARMADIDRNGVHKRDDVRAGAGIVNSPASR